MPADQRLLLAFAVAFAATALLTPLAILLARSTGFLDHPRGYKGHENPTPYLGGLAVGGGIALAAILFGSAALHYSPIALCAVGLWVVGTVDDRIGLNPGTRVFVALAVGVVTWATGLGWAIDADAVALLFTVLWVVGLVNAYNLMDNMDGAAGTVGCVSATGVGLIAATAGAPLLGAFALAVAGACAGFLLFNLASPARIFLGDGGSMPLGYLIAALAMSVPLGADMGVLAVAALAPVAALPILDVLLVIVSRRRRGITLLAGGRDHLTHRLRRVLPSTRAVAVVLAVSQAAACAVALGLTHLDPAALIGVLTASVGVLMAAIWALEQPSVAPVWTPVAPEEPVEEPAAAAARPATADQPIFLSSAHKQST